MHWLANHSDGLHICLALAGAALLRVDLGGGFYSLTFSAMTGMVNFCPVGVFRSVTTFVDLLRNFHAFKHSACILVGPFLKIPPLWIGLLFPRVGCGVEEDIVQFFWGHILVCS